MADPIASNSDDGKKIRQAENRALTKPKSKKFNKPGIRDHQASSFRLTVNITASHPRINRTATSDFHQITSSRTASFDSRNGPVAPISDWGTRVSVLTKDGTGANSTRTPNTELK